MAHPEINELMERLPTAFQPDQAEGLDVVLQFSASGAKGGDFYLTIAGGQCQAAEGVHSSPTTTFKADGQDMVDLMSGRADGMSLFMQGRLAVDGNMGIAMRMASLFKAG